MTRKRILSLAVTTGAIALTLVGTGCEKLKSRDQQNKGILSYKGARYGEAVEHFKSAVQLDPGNENARLYLATAYMTQWIPGADSPDNLKMAEAAKAEFARVLEKDPKSSVALQSLASMSYNQAQGLPPDQQVKKLDEAKDWYMKVIAADPQTKEAYYSLGVIVWSKWFPVYKAARSKMGMKPDDPGPLKDKKVREEMKQKWDPLLEDGLQNLKKSLEIDPQYDDAMAYVNLLTREKADLADTPEQYKKEIAEAESWFQKSIDTKKMKAAKAAPAGQ